MAMAAKSKEFTPAPSPSCVGLVASPDDDASKDGRELMSRSFSLVDCFMSDVGVSCFGGEGVPRFKDVKFCAASHGSAPWVAFPKVPESFSLFVLFVVEFGLVFADAGADIIGDE
jgi:hypothetical protein